MNKPFAMVGLHSGAIRRSDRIRRVLHDVRLRSTRQRIFLTALLMRDPTARVTADTLYDEAYRAQFPVSRAAVCNTLRALERTGLLKRIPDRRSRKVWFALDQRIVGSSA
jgi:Fe2+ or Zn2+ uptake regulation protein